MDIEQLTLSEWEEALPNTGYQVFHRADLLDLLAKYSTCDELQLYAGKKGQQVVGLLPLFVTHNLFGIKTISSPPPGMHVPYLGAVLMPTSPKVRKCERVNTRFTRGVLEHVGIDSKSLVFLVNSPRHTDPRPFEWEHLAVDTSFTYLLQIGDQSAEQLLKSFSKSRRREIRRGNELDLTVGRGDMTDARKIFQQTSDRFAEQDEYYGLTWPFVRDVLDALGEKYRVYVAREPDGSFLGGIIALYSGDTGSFWIGGVRAEYENISINSLLHWAIIQDIAEDSELADIETYDLVGAGEYRLSKFKSKFSPELTPYYVANSGGIRMQASKSAYGLLKNVQTRVKSTPLLNNFM